MNLSALKSAEDEDGVILRFYETTGREMYTEITLFREPKEVKVVNMLEEEDDGVEKELRQEGKRIKLTPLK